MFLRFVLYFVFALAASLAWGEPVQAQDGEEAQATERAADEKPKADAKADKKPAPPEEKVSRTIHSITIKGRELKYTAIAGTLLLKKEDGTPRASIFYIAYSKDGVADISKRPITFAFNGGPGSSSVWLHMGVLGPRRVLMDPMGNPLPPPYQLVDNEYTLLDDTDLVFIDPVTTGYSRAVPGQDPKQFHGVKEDLEAVGEFIRLYATRAGRWASPKFLAGESYGTTRAAGLSGYLQDRYGMFLNGIVLISSILNFQTDRFDPGNDLPPVLYLPSYAATAWYHKKLPADLQGDLEKTLREVREFAAGEYTLALMKGDTLTEAERNQIAQKLARYTGLGADYVLRTNLRIEISRFTKELLRDQRRTVGRFDSRFKGIDADSAGETFDYDPSFPIVYGPYTALFNQYVRSDLKFESDLPYEILTGRVQPWGFDGYENRYVNVAETLRGAMTQNRALRVFVANGHFDLATPFFATEYTFSHLNLEPSLRDHVQLAYYEAGHMMYIDKASVEKLSQDLKKFIQVSTPK